jgi:DTW domain-containing protein YfiP
MTRIYCKTCHRAEAGCICRFVCPVDNQPLVVLLQHPSEVKQSKGTVALLQLSLKRCVVFIGQDFSQHQGLTQIIDQYKNNISLLYPSEQANSLVREHYQPGPSQDQCIILLDGTWKKAYRMYMMSKKLHSIRQVSLPDGMIGQYLIRKTKKNNALSTLEASCYALAIIENVPLKYQHLLNKFVAFNQFQLSFLPPAHQPDT